MKEAFNPGDLVCLQNLTQPIMTVKGITHNGKGETFIVCSWFLNGKYMEENFVPDSLLNLNHHILSQISFNIQVDYENYGYEIACIKAIAAQIERLERMKIEEPERQAKTQDDKAE